MINDIIEELRNLNVKAEASNNFCGEPGIKSLQDDFIQLKHLRWMLDNFEDMSKSNDLNHKHHWIGFIQGLMWCTKMRNMSELYDESGISYCSVKNEI